MGESFAASGIPLTGCIQTHLSLKTTACSLVCPCLARQAQPLDSLNKTPLHLVGKPVVRAEITRSDSVRKILASRILAAKIPLVDSVQSQARRPRVVSLDQQTNKALVVFLVSQIIKEPHQMDFLEITTTLPQNHLRLVFLAARTIILQVVYLETQIKIIVLPVEVDFLVTRIIRHLRQMVAYLEAIQILPPILPVVVF